MKPYRTGVVFVHGIQGSPKQFDFLTAQLPPSVPFANVLLPGHGATVREFRRAGLEQWMEAVRRECLDMDRRCDRLIFVGHSMGCLLGLLANESGELFSDMLLLCCPFAIRFTYRYFRVNALSVFSKRIAGDPRVQAARRANSVSSKHAVGYLSCAHPYFELLRLIRRSRKQPLTLPERTAFYFSDQDEIVSQKCAAYVKKRFGMEPHTLSGCGHNYFTEEAKEQISRTLLRMIDE